MTLGNGVLTHERAALPVPARSSPRGMRGCSPITDAQFQALLDENRTLYEENQNTKALVEQLQEQVEQLRLQYRSKDGADCSASSSMSRVTRQRSRGKKGVKASPSTPKIDARTSQDSLRQRSSTPPSCSKQASKEQLQSPRSPCSAGKRTMKCALPWSQRTPVHNLLLMRGHLMHYPFELEEFAEVLDREGFVGRDSLRELTDDRADELGIPLKLAALLRAEAEKKDLQRKYTGPVRPFPEIEREEELLYQTPVDGGDMTPFCKNRASAKDSRSQVCKQVHRTCQLFYPPWELDKYAQRIEVAGFSTRESLANFSDKDAERLRVPVRVAAILRERAVEENSLTRCASLRKDLGSSLSSPISTRGVHRSTSSQPVHRPTEPATPASYGMAGVSHASSVARILPTASGNMFVSSTSGSLTARQSPRPMPLAPPQPQHPQQLQRMQQPQQTQVQQPQHLQQLHHQPQLMAPPPVVVAPAQPMSPGYNAFGTLGHGGGSTPWYGGCGTPQQTHHSVTLTARDQAMRSG